MASPPESTKTSLRQRLLARAWERWPQLATVHVRQHGAYAYIAGELADGTALPLFRLHNNASASSWRFAIYRASYPFGTHHTTWDPLLGLPSKVLSGFLFENVAGVRGE